MEKIIAEAKNIGIVHHNKDTDGFLSGALVKYYLHAKEINNNKLIPYNYETDFNLYVKDKLKLDIDKFDLLIFVDCSPPKNWFENCVKFETHKIIIIDHHKNSLEELIDVVSLSNNSFSAKINYTTFEHKIKKITYNEQIYFFCSLTEGPRRVSAAYLVFQKFNNKYNSELENFVNLTSLYDTWRWFDSEKQKIINENSLYLETYLRSMYDKLDTDEEKLMFFFNRILLQDFSLSYLCDKGEKLYMEKMSEINYSSFQFIKNSINTQQEEYENLLILTSFGIKPSFVNQFYPRQYFKTLLNINVDLMMYFKFDYVDNKVNVSMRSIYLDIPKFIRYLDLTFGDEENRILGGGHTNAGGCSMTIKTFNNFINTFKFC